MQYALIADVLYPLDKKSYDDYQRVKVPLLHLRKCGSDDYIGILFKVNLTEEVVDKYSDAVCWLIKNGSIVQLYYQKGAIGFEFSSIKNPEEFINSIVFWQKRFEHDARIQYKETNRNLKEIVGFIYNAFVSDKKFITVNDIANMTKELSGVKTTQVGRFHILTIKGKDFVCERGLKDRYDKLFSFAYHVWKECKNALNTESSVTYVMGTHDGYPYFPHVVIPLKDETCWFKT